MSYESEYDKPTIVEVYKKFNPFIRFVIKPVLKAVDASSHPIRGGMAVALSSGLTHYAIMELIGQLLGDTDPNTNLVFTQLSIRVHIAVITNMICNLGIGINKSFERQLENHV